MSELTATVPDTDIPALSLDGNGAPQFARLRTANNTQLQNASTRVERVLPGFSAAERINVCGIDTPSLSEVSFDAATLGDVRRALDRYLTTGDLQSERAVLVDTTSQRGRSIPTGLMPLRQGAFAAQAIDSYAGAKALERGETLVLNETEHRLGSPVTDLALDISTALRAHVQVNAYVSSDGATGFGVHWDDHDVVIIQLAGRKYWDVEAPPELAPIKSFTPRGGSGRSAWSGVLSPGTALAIPRGWPHSVQGVSGDVSVHLTVSISRPNAIALLSCVPGDELGQGLPIEALLRRGRAIWNSRLLPFAIGGPIELADARSNQYSGYSCRLLLPGGLVFATNKDDGDAVTLSLPSGLMCLPVHLVACLAESVEREWWTADDLVTATGASVDDVLVFIDLLAQHQVLGLEVER